MESLKASEVLEELGAHRFRAPRGCLQLHVGGHNTSVVTTKAREDEKVWPSAKDYHS